MGRNFTVPAALNVVQKINCFLPYMNNAVSSIDYARRTLELSAELRGIRALRLKAIAHVCAQILASFPAFETLRRESNVFDNFRLARRETRVCGGR